VAFTLRIRLGKERTMKVSKEKAKLCPSCSNSMEIISKKDQTYFKREKNIGKLIKYSAIERIKVSYKCINCSTFALDFVNKKPHKAKSWKEYSNEDK